MIKPIKKLTFFVYFFIIFFLTLINVSKAKIYKDIVISGNERLSIETILMFSGLKTNLNLDDQDLNKAIKKLYETNYFKNIIVSTEGETLNIEVLENPIIQSIKIDGIKNKDILRQLYNFTKKKEKYPFLKNQIKDQKNFLLNIVRSTGFYFAKIETLIIDNKNNSVDVLYKFDLGTRAKIKKIVFQGDKIFRDSKLRNIIKSEEGKFWKFLSSDKFLNERKIQNDENLLKDFYKNKGFYNVKIKSSYVKNVDNKFFELIFNIDAGNKFYFNEIILDLNNDFDIENFKKIKKNINELKGEKYSPKKLDKIIDEIDKIVLQREYLFLNTKYETTIKENNKIDVSLKFEDLEKFYVDQINVFGNFITEEKVIRNSLIIDEGDAFNEVLYKKSINRYL